jgi:hypothetical protein
MLRQCGYDSSHQEGNCATCRILFLYVSEEANSDLNLSGIVEGLICENFARVFRITGD